MVSQSHFRGFCTHDDGPDASPIAQAVFRLEGAENLD
jgi:hypothetical protein